MAGDDAGTLAVRLAQQLAAALRHKAVGRAVEAVAPHTVFFIIRIRHRKHIRLCRHGLVKSGVKHRHLRHLAAESSCCRTDSLQMRRVMQRRKGGKVRDVLHHLVVDEHRAVVFRAALHHTVADRRHLMQILNHLALAGGQRPLNHRERRRMIRHGLFDHHHPAVPGLMGELAVDADPLAVALGQHLFTLGVDQLIFQ